MPSSPRRSSGSSPSAVRVLAPQTVIYEFLKASYDESFGTSAGKLLGPDFRPRPGAVAAVRIALREARTPATAPPTAYVLDDLEGLPDAAAVLALRTRLAVLAMRRSLTFVPEADVARLPSGAVVFVPDAARLAALRERLAPRNVAVESAEALLGDPPARPATRPR